MFPDHTPIHPLQDLQDELPLVRSNLSGKPGEGNVYPAEAQLVLHVVLTQKGFRGSTPGPAAKGPGPTKIQPLVS